MGWTIGVLLCNGTKIWIGHVNIMSLMRVSFVVVILIWKCIRWREYYAIKTGRKCLMRFTLLESFTIPVQFQVTGDFWKPPRCSAMSVSFIWPSWTLIFWSTETIDAMCLFINLFFSFHTALFSLIRYWVLSIGHLLIVQFGHTPLIHAIWPDCSESRYLCL